MVELLSFWPREVVIFLFFIVGSLFGSFANVVILRLPLGKSVVRPRSHCPKCQHQLQWFELVPIFSWIFLRGKCRNCHAKISWRYPLVEFLTAIAFAGAFIYHGWSFYLLEHIVFIYCLIIVSFVDFDHMILPDTFTLSGIVIGLLGSWINPGRNRLDSVYGVLMGGGFLWAIAYVYFLLRKQEGMGGGDIKLLAWIGAVLGWQAIPFVVLSSSLFGSIVGLAVGLKTKGGMQTVIPFGPYLALSAVLYIFGGYNIGLWYLNLFLPGIQ